MPNYTILLVDYEPRSVERSRRPLIDAGFKVHLAPDGVAALEAFERLKPDLVLIEAMLPKKNGFEVCQELRQTPNGKNTPILITTAVYRGRKYRSQALHVHGASEYIEKPIADDQLVAIVRRFLQGTTSKRPSRPEDAASAPPELTPARHAKPAPIAAAPTPPVTAPAAKAPVAAVAATPPPAAAVAVAAAKPAATAPPPALTATAVAEKTPSPRLESNERAERAALVLVAEPREPMPAMPAMSSAGAPGGLSAAATATWRAAANAMIGGLTEDEISERLDALLPLGGGDSAASSTPAATDEPSSDTFDLEAAADVLAETDPDFDAGTSMDAAIFPMVPAESTDIAERPAEGSDPADDDRPDADVVRFDARRSKKRGKKSKNKPAATVAPPAPPRVEPAPRVETVPLKVEPRTVIAPTPLPVMPSAKMASEKIEAPPAPRRRSIPIWVWFVLAAAIAAGVYFFFFQSEFTVTEQSTPAPVAVASKALPPSTPPPVTPEPSSSTSAPEESGADGSPATDPASTRSSPSSASEPAKDSTTLAASVPRASPASLVPAIPASFRSSASSSMKTRPVSSTKRNQTSKTNPIERPESASLAASTSLPASAPPAMNPAVGPSPIERPAVTSPSMADTTPTRSEIANPAPEPAIEPAANQLSTPSDSPSARPVKEGDLVPLASADQPPIAVSRPAPAYPKQARDDGQQGEVSLSLLIDETGRVADLRVVNAATDEFGSAASKVARTWTYKPAMKNGVRIKVWKPERVIFKL